MRMSQRSEAACFQERAVDVVGQAAEAEGEPRKCSSRPLIASVGPLLVPGRSKNASTSAARFFNVRPSVTSSLRAAGTPWLRELMTALILPWDQSLHQTRDDSRLAPICADTIADLQREQARIEASIEALTVSRDAINSVINAGRTVNA